MIKTSLLLACIFLLIASARAQQSQELNWEPYRFLLGEWIGEGSGTPGEATGGFSFSFDLEKKILVRKNYANYPATKDKPAYSHTDLMVIYQDAANNATRAIYFDSEGHVINYAVAFSNDNTRLVFTSEPSASAPRFRFTYNTPSDGRLTFEFEIAPPGKPDAFSKYVQGSARRKITSLYSLPSSNNFFSVISVTPSLRALASFEPGSSPTTR
jgi:hypothetical protein